jgi:hypothetical protein
MRQRRNRNPSDESIDAVLSRRRVEQAKDGVIENHEVQSNLHAFDRRAHLRVNSLTELAHVSAPALSMCSVRTNGPISRKSIRRKPREEWLADKIARMAWAMMAKGEHYGEPVALAVWTADICFGDVIDFLGNDAMTRAILLDIEYVRSDRGFMSVGRGASRNKPILK